MKPLSIALICLSSALAAALIATCLVYKFKTKGGNKTTFKAVAPLPRPEIDISLLQDDQIYTKRDYVLLLTCTVNLMSHGKCFGNKSKEEREKWYVDSITLWKDITDAKIVVVENSGHDFSSTFTANERLEFVYVENETLQADLSAVHHTIKAQKGQLELHSISHAIQNSQLIKNLPDDGIVCKVTGKYFLPELPKILERSNVNVTGLIQNCEKNCEVMAIQKKMCHIVFRYPAITSIDSDFIELYYFNAFRHLTDVYRLPRLKVDPPIFKGNQKKPKLFI